MKLSPAIERELLARGKLGPRAGANLPKQAQPSLVPGFAQHWLLVTGRSIGETGAVFECRFDDRRLWRFDVAWPEKRVAVELHGGTWQQGRHQRGAGFMRDREKMRAAIGRGWRVLEYTDQDLRERPVQVVEEVRRALQSQREGDRGQ